MCSIGTEDSKEIESFGRRFIAEGPLYLPAAYAKYRKLLSVEQKDGQWQLYIKDGCGHLEPMPVLNVREAYLQCRRGADTENFARVLVQYVSEYEKAEKEEQRQKQLLTGLCEEFPKGQLAFVLLPEGSRAARHFPGRSLGDAFLIYAVGLFENGRLEMIAVTREIAEKWGAEEETLYQETKRSEPFLIPYQILEEKLFTGEMYYIITSKWGCWGLGTLLYEDGPLQELAQEKNSDLYLLPLSVHEAAAFAAAEWDEADLRELGRKISPFGAVWYYSRRAKSLAFTEKERTAFAQMEKYGIPDAAERSEIGGTE